MLAPLLARISEEQVPLFLALAERRAAARYRVWADAATDGDVRRRLLECSEREEEIARRVEGLFPEAGATQDAIGAAIPELADLIRSAFDDRSLREQLALQAEGERLGAATWRSLAEKAADPAMRATFPKCADLEERSAEVLEELLAGATWPFAAA